MRHKATAIVLFLFINYAWAQDTVGTDTTPGMSAYDIFGISPSSETDTASNDAVADEATAAANDESTEVDSTEETVISGDEAEDSVTISLIEDTDVTEASLAGNDESEVPVIVESIAADLIESDTAEYSADEEVLLEEITRLLAERDELYGAINDLRAENATLTAQAADAEYYRGRAVELETEIGKLEEALRLKDEELAVADSRLVELETLLADEGAMRADAESRLAAASGDAEAVDSMLASREDIIAKQEEIITSKDAALALKDGEIEARNRALEVKKEEFAALSEKLKTVEEELINAQADLTAAKVAEREALGKLADKNAEPQGEAGEDTMESATLVDSALASALESVAEAERRIVLLTAERDAAIASMDAANKARDIAEAARLVAEDALSAAKAAGTVVSGEPGKDGYLSGWKLDSSKFTKKMRDGFDGSSARLGAWKISGTTASQSDASQYFSRLEMPVAQSKSTTLYRFKARSTGKGWVGLGLHLFVEDVKKKRGYGEGKSLLVWFTRDKAARGDEATYVQLYRSDDDVVMERMFDAELSDGLDAWKLVEIVYDPRAEYIAVSVDGVLRIVYKTFFGRDSGATVSLRTLGGGGSFSEFSVWSE